uniref:RING-type domain-containing protein n=1 Tax=Prymnesium polylepis TaxID=72548 RepID=A0A7S4HD85_9EUKA
MLAPPPRMRTALVAQFSSITVPESFVAELRGYFAAISSDEDAPPPAVSDNEFAQLSEVRRSSSESALASQDDCVVCLQRMAPMTRLKELPCGHVFHAACLRRWLGKSRCCPCCRAELPQCDNGQCKSKSGESAFARSAPITTRVIGRTADGGKLLRVPRQPTPSHLGGSRRGGEAASVIVRFYEQPPAAMLHARPDGVPDDAHLLVARYPTGTARVWRFVTTVEQERRARGSRLPRRELQGLRAGEVEGRSFPISVS